MEDESLEKCVKNWSLETWSVCLESQFYVDIVKVLPNVHNFLSLQVIIAREIEQKLGPWDDERIEY